MADYSTIVTALATRLSSVTAIGQVHAYYRWSAHWTDLLAQYKTTISSVPQIRGWYITREEITPAGTAPFGSVHRRHEMVIRGLMGVDDSANTETTFNELVDLVMDAIDVPKDLGATSVIDYSIGDCEARTIEHRDFGGVLCHYCEIVTPVIRERVITYV